jgi:hypothetical protein
MFSYITLLYTLFFFEVIKSDEVKLKGGLIYKYEGAAQINQEYATFKRALDTSALGTVAQRLHDSRKLYTEFCNLVSDYDSKNPGAQLSHKAKLAKQQNITVYYIATPLKYPLRDTLAVCSRLAAKKS